MIKFHPALAFTAAMLAFSNVRSFADDLSLRDEFWEGIKSAFRQGNEGLPGMRTKLNELVANSDAPKLISELSSRKNLTKAEVLMVGILADWCEANGKEVMEQGWTGSAFTIADAWLEKSAPARFRFDNEMTEALAFRSMCLRDDAGEPTGSACRFLLLKQEMTSPAELLFIVGYTNRRALSNIAPYLLASIPSLDEPFGPLMSDYRGYLEPWCGESCK